MSVVVAVQKDGIVYMGCDTQTTIGKNVKKKVIIRAESEYKISRFDNGVLVGACGTVAAHAVLNCHGDIFKFDGDVLTKKIVVMDMVPKIRELMKEHGFIDEDGDMQNSFTVAHRDRLFGISIYGDVVRVCDHYAHGAGKLYAYHSLMDEALPVRERILGAMRASAKRCESVDAPYVLIDTKNLEYEVVEG